MAHSPKVLLIYAHPESPSSVANQLLLQAARRLSNVTVHDLYAHYPDFLSIFIMSSICCAIIRSSCFNTPCIITAVRPCLKSGWIACLRAVSPAAWGICPAR